MARLLLGFYLLCIWRFPARCRAADAFVLEGDTHSIKVFYINLKDADLRRRHMEAQFEKYWVNAERVEAIDHTRVSSGEFDADFVVPQGVADRIMEEATTDGLFAQHIRNSTVACFLSHTTLLQRLAEKGQLGSDELALILEDDVSIPIDWVSRLKAVVQAAPPDWSLLKVSGWGSMREHDRISGGSWLWSQVAAPMLSFLGGPPLGLSIYRTAPPFMVGWHPTLPQRFYYAGSSGYLVRGETLPLLLAHLRSQPISDFDEMLLSKGDYRAYEFYPHVFELSGDQRVENMHTALADSEGALVAALSSVASELGMKSAGRAQGTRGAKAGGQKVLSPLAE
eukprot:CAMPEP_0178431476 /NCGR_PEP_ID=MMETSP0689_2-20121128/31869_1 /TAXON_ID=160604 /ORGANISM="Amphidinium massartii, Strain CS-259" /LENGTH=338 /DNA_ID=CAMNT_0020053393 /DNA_START=10 /DNA_END=1026 /DNA_ORIENTATION=-